MRDWITKRTARSRDLKFEKMESQTYSSSNLNWYFRIKATKFLCYFLVKLANAKTNEKN